MMHTIQDGSTTMLVLAPCLLVILAASMGHACRRQSTSASEEDGDVMGKGPIAWAQARSLLDPPLPNRTLNVATGRGKSLSLG